MELHEPVNQRPEGTSKLSTEMTERERGLQEGREGEGNVLPYPLVFFKPQSFLYPDLDLCGSLSGICFLRHSLPPFLTSRGPVVSILPKTATSKSFSSSSPPIPLHPVST